MRQKILFFIIVSIVKETFVFKSIVNYITTWSAKNHVYIYIYIDRINTANSSYGNTFEIMLFVRLTRETLEIMLFVRLTLRAL